MKFFIAGPCVVVRNTHDTSTNWRSCYLAEDNKIVLDYSEIHFMFTTAVVCILMNTFDTLQIFQVGKMKMLTNRFVSNLQFQFNFTQGR